MAYGCPSAKMRTEPAVQTLAFSHTLVPLKLSARQRLDDVVARTSNLPFGGTDCALPMRWALKERVAVDTFVVYTDSETWFGAVHSAAPQAMRDFSAAA